MLSSWWEKVGTIWRYVDRPVRRSFDCSMRRPVYSAVWRPFICPVRRSTTAHYGGVSTATGGGMSTSSSNVYMSNIPPWPVFLREMESRGYLSQADLIRHHLPEFLHPENFF